VEYGVAAAAVPHVVFLPVALSEVVETDCAGAAGSVSDMEKMPGIETYAPLAMSSRIRVVRSDALD